MREGAIGTAHLETARVDLGERLRAGHFVDEMQVDIEHAGRVGGFWRTTMWASQTLSNSVRGELGGGMGASMLLNGFGADDGDQFGCR